MDAPPAKLSLIVFSDDYARVHYALAAAAAAAAVDRPATLFFTMGAARALRAASEDGEAGWRTLAGAGEDAALQARGVAGFDELLESCAELGVRFLVCEMGLRAIDLTPQALRGDLDIAVAGLVTFLNDARGDGAMLFL